MKSVLLARLSGMKSLRETSGAIRPESGDRRGRSAASRPRASPAQWQLGAEHFAVGDLPAPKASIWTSSGPTRAHARCGLAQVLLQSGLRGGRGLYRKALGVIPFPNTRLPSATCTRGWDERMKR
jgi:hypothetical protein